MGILTALCLAASAASAASALSTSSASSSVSNPIMSKPSRLSIGATALRDVVKRAARDDASSSSGNLDLGGVAWLEHINLVVGSQSQAEHFYQDFLGFSRDPNAKFHVNLGQQQLHLAENGDPAQVIAGSVGLVVPDLDTVRGRIEAAADFLQGTKFCVIEDSVDDEGRMTMTVSCPWGNTFHLYCAARDDAALSSQSDSPHKMVKLHADGGSYSADRMAVRGQPGIRFIEIAVGEGTVPPIMRFYEEMMGCSVSAPSEGRAAVSVGPGVHLVFVDNAELTEEDRTAMEGVHVCVYADGFRSLYDRLSERGLIWTNPRFTHLDSCDTWEQAAASRTLRFKDVVDLNGGEKRKLLELEHETRPLRHGQYMKVPFYTPK